MKQLPHLTPGEFELMEILWVLGEGSVRDVLEKVRPQRKLAYTTVMTVLQKMRKKGLLVHRKRKKAYIYSPAIQRHEALDAVLSHITETYFQGSRTDLVRYITGGATPPPRPAPQPAPESAASTARDGAKGRSIPATDAAMPDLDEYLL